MFKDGRDYQILFLSTFFTLGIFFRDWTVRPLHVIAILATSLIVQHIADRIAKTQNPSIKSALITAISLCALLRANTATVMIIAAAASILCKFVFRYRGKHFFNPSNFGIIFVLSLTGNAWVTPGQWGNDAWLVFLFAATGLMVVRKVGRWDTSGAFLGIYALFEFARNLWLGWTVDVFAHKMMSGSLLLFTFFMITDPRAIPDRRSARIIWAAMVAALTFVLRNYYFMTTAPFWALFALSPLTILFDRLLPADRFTWSRVQTRTEDLTEEVRMKKLGSLAMKNLMIGLIAILGFTGSASAFCGFFVAKADTKLFNQASKVILVRDGERTVITMANDFEGEAKDFAIVVPVPVVLKKDQVHVGDPKILDRLDAFSAPRLVEYFDPDPCVRVDMMEGIPRPTAQAPAGAGGARAKSLGVTIEEQFTVGEYDILILSATESTGLETWLQENGYKIPKGAAELLQPYIRSNTKFFVAKVNLKEFDKRGLKYLRPLQMAFEHKKFMLPIRLGMVNAKGPQDLIIFALSREGRTEVTNYRTVNIPSNMDVPVYVKNEFSDFYRAMFQRAYEKESRNAVFVEYAWDMAWCDPCAADPLSSEELRKAGVFWLDSSSERNQAQNVFITRIHARYTRDLFPEDLVFQATPNRQNYQGRYILRHPFKGEAKCEEGRRYFRNLPQRFEKEAQTLASLTGWEINDIRNKMGMKGDPKTEEEKSWWNKIFDDDDEEE